MPRTRFRPRSSSWSSRPDRSGFGLAGPLAASCCPPRRHPGPVVRGAAREHEHRAAAARPAVERERRDCERSSCAPARGDRPAAGAVPRAGGALRLAGRDSREGGPAPGLAGGNGEDPPGAGARNVAGPIVAGAAWDRGGAHDLREKVLGGARSERSKLCCRVR